MLTAVLAIAVPAVSAAGPTPAPFRLPLAGPPGPDTWLLGQPYGNTTGAYFLGDAWYASGQGLHFGLDFIAPCGTPVLSIGDGTVVAADWLARGSGPHNLVVRHPAHGVAVLYGHLLERPDLEPGAPVARGQTIARTGDPDGSCHSRPHLHLEVRDLDYGTAYNPLRWIRADWDALMLYGPPSDIAYARDRDDPLRWVRPEDQPAVELGGPPLNRYRRAWPATRSDGACVVTPC